MTKIRNRFTTGEIITVHDNLLCDLYSLNRDSGFICVEINNNQYLVNQKKGRGYIIGLRVKIPDELLIVNGVRSKFDDLDSDIKEEIEDKLSSRLYFSNIEIYVANMLFDKFLRCGNNCKTSIQELDGYYRKCKKDYSKVHVTKNVYDRYIETLKSLVEKELFLETTDSFRNDKYGARDINFSHMFLSVFQIEQLEMNNMEFNYSFHNFGSVIKQCRRYSNTLSRYAFKIRLNQTMKYVTSFFIARDVFITKGNLIRNPSYVKNEMTITSESYEDTIKYEGRKNNNQGYSMSYKLNSFNGIPNKQKIRKMFINYIECGFALCDVYRIEEEFSYNETEEFVEKHEFDYDENYDLNYEFSKDDIGKDVDIKLHIYVSDPFDLLYYQM